MKGFDHTTFPAKKHLFARLLAKLRRCRILQQPTMHYQIIALDSCSLISNHAQLESIIYIGRVPLLK